MEAGWAAACQNPEWHYFFRSLITLSGHLHKQDLNDVQNYGGTAVVAVGLCPGPLYI